MARALTVAMVVAGVSLLTGSAANADEKLFASVVQGLKDPAFFKATVDFCVKGVRKDPNAVQFNVGLTGLPAARAPQVSCARLMTAYRDGRYTYEHHKAVSAGTYPPAVVRIIQGR